MIRKKKPIKQVAGQSKLEFKKKDKQSKLDGEPSSEKKEEKKEYTLEEKLKSYSKPELSKIISATNITGYSKLKKDELIKLMLRPEHKERFKDVRHKSERMGGLGKKINKDLNAKRKEQEKIDVKKAKEAIEETKLSEEKKEELKEVVDEYKNASEDVLKGMPKIPAWLIKGAPPPRS